MESTVLINFQWNLSNQSFCSIPCWVHLFCDCLFLWFFDLLAKQTSIIPSSPCIFGIIYYTRYKQLVWLYWSCGKTEIHVLLNARSPCRPMYVCLFFCEDSNRHNIVCITCVVTLILWLWTVYAFCPRIIIIIHSSVSMNFCHSVRAFAMIQWYRLLSIMCYNFLWISDLHCFLFCVIVLAVFLIMPSFVMSWLMFFHGWIKVLLSSFQQIFALA